MTNLMPSTSFPTSVAYGTPEVGELCSTEHIEEYPFRVGRDDLEWAKSLDAARCTLIDGRYIIYMRTFFSSH